MAIDETATTRPDIAVPTPDLEQVEAAFRQAIDTGRRERLPLAGAGELTVAVRWRHDAGDCVIKRVPPSRSRPAAEQYMAAVDDFVTRLEACGVRCVATGQHALDRPDGSVVVFETQPLLDVVGLADNVLRRATPSTDHPVITAIVDRIVTAISSGTPIDGQVANWYWFEGEPWQLDLSTPMYVDADGTFAYDPYPFLQQVPAVVRPYVRKQFARLASHYIEADYVITDLMTQLHRQRLDHWCEAVTAYARSAHGIDVSAAKAAELSADEARFYPWLHRLKRTQRWWMQHTRRRYDTLLPESSTYG
jgi:hypothetical protein